MKRYALVIGIGQYQYLKGLSKPAGDAAAVRSVLQERGDFSLEIPLLVDERATQANVQAALKRVLKDQGKGAEVLIYFTGHGFVAGESEYEQKGYLATYDCRVTIEGDSPEERLRQRIISAQQGISFEFLNGLIGETELAGLAVMLDCCHSEWFIDQALIGESLKVFFEKGSYFLSAACRSFEVARAKVGTEHSVYSGALLAALGNGGAGRITVLDAHNSIVKALAKARQEPISFGFGTGFVLVDDRVVASTQIEVSEVCPYQGLNSFTPETRQFFFGRGKEIQTLVQKVHHSRFVPIVGASGSGKSSMVRAGLVPWLDELGWRILPVITPGTDPMAMLRSVIENLDESTENMLLVVDQFEEVFTLCRDRGEQSQFIQGLQELAGVRVVVTMRADFVEACLAHAALTRTIEADAVWLGPLLGENLEAAIAQPAKLQGVTLQERLLARILKDVEAEENCLPLLEFALQQLWEQLVGTELTRAAYDKLGGVTGALNAHAEAIYKQLAGQKREHWVQRIMLRLVRTGEGTEDSRQRQRKADLLGMAKDTGEQEAIEAVIDALVNGRLLVSGVDGDVIDLSHEALIKYWHRFAGWRENDRDARRLLHKIENAHQQWTKNKRRRQDLLEGRLLRDSKQLLKDAPTNVVEEMQEFIRKSSWWRLVEASFPFIITTVVTLGLVYPIIRNISITETLRKIDDSKTGDQEKKAAVLSLTRGCLITIYLPSYIRENLPIFCHSLSRLKWQNAPLSGVNLNGSNFHSARFYNSDFSGASLIGINFDSASLEKSSFKTSNLTSAFLHSANLQGNEFERSNLTQVNLDSAQVESSRFRQVKFNDAFLHSIKIKRSNFDRAELRRVNLDSAQIEDTEFRNSKLNGAFLHSTQIKRTIFERTDLSGSNFDSATIEDVNFRGSQLNKAFLHSIKITSSNLDEANLSDVNFDRSQLKNVSFRFSNLSSSYLHGSHIIGSDFSEANLNGANLNNVKFECLQKPQKCPNFRNIKWDKSTNWQGITGWEKVQNVPLALQEQLGLILPSIHDKPDK